MFRKKIGLKFQEVKNVKRDIDADIFFVVIKIEKYLFHVSIISSFITISKKTKTSFPPHFLRIFLNGGKNCIKSLKPYQVLRKVWGFIFYVLKFSKKHSNSIFFQAMVMYSDKYKNSRVQTSVNLLVCYLSLLCLKRNYIKFFLFTPLLKWARNSKEKADHFAKRLRNVFNLFHGNILMKMQLSFIVLILRRSNSYLNLYKI